MEGPANLGLAVRLVAHLGGYRSCMHDPGPGNRLMWHGYDTLTKATRGRRIGLKQGWQHGREA